MRLLLVAALGAAVAAAKPLPLAGDWKWSTEDRPEFSQPTFSDSSWRTLALPLRGTLPLGVNWLRKTVTVPTPGRELSLVIGGVDACYDAFVNGRKVRQSPCNQSGGTPFPLPRMAPIPAGVIGEDGRAVIALRVDRRSILGTIGMVLPEDEGPYAIVDGAYAGPVIDAARHMMERSLTLSGLYGLAQQAVGLLLIVFWLGNRRRTELLWFGLFLVGVGWNNIGGLVLMHIDQQPDLLVRPGMLGLVALVFACSRLLRGQASPGWPALAALTLGFLGEKAGYVAALPFVFAAPFVWSLQAIRRGTLEQRLFGFAIVAYTIAIHGRIIQAILPVWPIPYSVHLGPYIVTTSASVSLGVGVIAMLVLFRMAGADARERARLASEMEAARGVQQLLLDTGEPSSEYPVEAVYLPATEVGGDFYQRLPDGAGGFTIAVGDVSGKGLKAAMVVSMVVGILRNNRDSSPGAMLAAVNDAIFGTLGGGFVTCVCAHFAPGGRVRLANAGHLTPLLDGAECEVEAGLPLGVVQGAGFNETEIALPAGSTMTFYSDGVVEAANTRGELLGFERTLALSSKPAATIAEEARAWGQNDDITVVTVRRSA